MYPREYIFFKRDNTSKGSLYFFPFARLRFVQAFAL